VLVLLGIAFLAGLITAISPCVLPVLPIVLAGGAAGTSRARPFAIVAGLVVSFTTFTLAGAALLSAVGLPADVLRDLAIATLLLLAASLLSRRIAWLLARPFAFLSRRQVARDSNGFVVGLSVGLVFVPCAGPVLATVTALAASGDVGLRTVLVTGTYALGAALPMLAVASGAQRLASGMSALRAHAETMRRLAGVTIAVAALAISLGLDQRFTTAVPGYTEALQERIEDNATARAELRKLNGSTAATAESPDGGERAPELQGIVGWLNTRNGRPTSIAALRGKVVLVDFWTYSCINCLRTLPHLKAWDRAYRDDGLRIIGVHSPEFAFERVPENVRSAVRRLGIRYPVALDNDFATWRAYSNRYWPAKYLIDATGRVRYQHFGEGAYEETENRIRSLLGERPRAQGAGADEEPIHVPQTPESYLGYTRLDRFANAHVVPDREWDYRFPPGPVPLDHVAYDGWWTVESERIVAGDGARLRLRFLARDIFLVLSGSGRVEVLVGGKAVRTVHVAGTPRLHTLVRLPRSSRGLLELRFSPGLAAYAFTFG
jgi:cytochrome c biogenesis protein CcdA/thiol-disulfide isomerase/thioredoxin